MITEIKQQQNNQHEKLLTVSEVAKILRCDSITVRRWISAGALEAVALPHLNKRTGYRIKASVLDTLLGEK